MVNNLHQINVICDLRFSGGYFTRLLKKHECLLVTDDFRSYLRDLGNEE